MGFFDFLKKDDVADYSMKYNIQKTIAEKQQSDSSQTAQSPSQAISNELSNPSESAEERRKKLVKRIVDMAERMENLSIQLYHLQQRIELIEKKMNINS
ncbi:hypothetical protein HY449_00295 [Candidatus Pacearchaeota archaeon]|nr:hypothetical protein [Candidatus Pacearchaeota archaeon]